MRETCPHCGQSLVGRVAEAAVAAALTSEVCSRPGCGKRMATDNYCEDGHCRPVRELRPQDHPLGGYDPEGRI